MARIIHLSEAALIAFHAMGLIRDRAPEKTSTRLIAQTTGASENHTAKVMQLLVRRGFIRSVRGPGGGFLPGDNFKLVTLLDIYRAIDGEIETKCPFRRQNCMFKSCLFGSILGEANQKITDYLQSTKLVDA